jgi:hypothetical protein
MKTKYLVFFTLLFMMMCSRWLTSIGKSSEVVVLASKIEERLVIENVQQYNYVPQEEGTFEFIFAGDTALEQYKNHHALLLYGTLQDDIIRTILSKDAREATEKDTFTVFKKKDLWARGQIAIILAVNDPAYLERAFARYGQLIGQALEEHHYSRVKMNYYDAGISSGMKDRLKKYGMTLDISDAWLIDSMYQADNFIVIHTHFPDRSIFFHKGTNPPALDKGYALAKRDSLTARYYDGDYILQELTTAEPIEFANMRGIRLRGVWQNDSLVAGGPFLSYFLKSGDSLYVIDGIVFNPGERKTDYLTMIEVIMNSFRLIRP